MTARFACAACSADPNGSASPGSPSVIRAASDPSAEARRIGQEALTQAIDVHDRFAFGFRYIGGRGSGFEITANAYRGILSVLDAVSFQSRTLAQLEEADAKYFHLQNAVRFQTARLGDSSTAGSMLHELVHALQDRARFQGLNWEWEATAYMAQALWYAGKGALGGARVDQYLEAYATTPSNVLFQQAAERCLALGAGRGIVEVRAADLTRLESMLRTHAKYGRRAGDLSVGDGVGPA